MAASTHFQRDIVEFSLLLGYPAQGRIHAFSGAIEG
jgi:hypothetical protein